ncbi:actin-related protein 2/3 complex subunit 2-like [Schistocerca gregaria]|uniref:actin-related protein 2/3 complex subunit 2-like n=1 Tax=Schistocerca gregaria TaxID=7010 RepID=UPI00211EB5D6|nr:actin-related protein 2/3 complex subunit 2-like [Schistocerca gregaria]
MILLEQSNHIVETTLNNCISSLKDGKLAPFELTCADFDGVIFHLNLPKDKNVLSLSIDVPCYDKLVDCGVEKNIKAIYKDHVVKPEPNASVTLALNLDTLSSSPPSLISELSLLKRHILASAFYHTFEAVEAKKSILLDIPFHGDDRTFITTKDESVIVVITVNFKDSEDIVFGKVFLNEFKKSVSGAPAVDFSTTPPGEISSIKNLQKADGYITCVLFERHYKADFRDKTINLILMLRNYLMYHIKCSKSQLNTRMRLRVEALLKILNRAKQELPKEKKTASGRTFTRTTK